MFHKFYHPTGAKRALIGVVSLNGTITASIPRIHAVNPPDTWQFTSFVDGCDKVISEIDARIAELQEARNYLQGLRDTSECLGGELPV